ncbi:MAG: transglutaminase-like cysteine peptidase [Sphingomonas bacterium]|nr:transglutaminase-like cysteine peptidase [Sphingomonas bacterium]
MKILTMASAILFAPTSVSAAVPTDRLAPIDRGTVIVNARAIAPVSPNIFGTVALGAGVTAYGARWRRVSAADQFDPRVKALAAAAVASGNTPVARLASIHADVGRRVRWQRDLDTYHVSDYWAYAGETLTRGEGDSEDIAILKMQVLKAAGFSPRDIYLSVGRDQLRGADTLLLVRIGSDFYALDDRSPRPVQALGAARFKPVITLGRDTAWIHGRRIVARQ